MRASLDAAYLEYEKQLPGSPGESALLARGLTEKTLEDFHLGYVRDPLIGHEDYSGYLAVPYLTKAGPVGIRFKRIANQGAKVLALRGTKALPYNVAALSKSGSLYITEGEPDTWAAHQAGLNALGIPGVDSWQPLWRRLLRNAERVVMLQQGDTKIPEGMKVTPAVQLTQTLTAGGVRMTVIAFPPGEDVNSYMQAKGEQQLREFVGE